jgi:hypothetical protein
MTRAERMVEDMTRLRDELMERAFASGNVRDMALAEVVWKINSCLGRGYPRRDTNKESE